MLEGCHVMAKIPPIKLKINPMKNPPPLTMLNTEKTMTNIPPVLTFSMLSLLIKNEPTITKAPEIKPIVANIVTIVNMYG